eukprot:3117928-Rhodomonas_salina.3
MGYLRPRCSNKSKRGVRTDMCRMRCERVVPERRTAVEWQAAAHKAPIGRTVPVPVAQIAQAGRIQGTRLGMRRRCREIIGV